MKMPQVQGGRYPTKYTLCVTACIADSKQITDILSLTKERKGSSIRVHN